MQIYKIKDRDTGLYSTGGTNPNWSKTGKVWNSTRSLKSHLRQFMKSVYQPYGGRECPLYNKYGRGSLNQIPENWEIVTIEVVETEANISPARDAYPDFIPS